MISPTLLWTPWVSKCTYSYVLSFEVLKYHVEIYYNFTNYILQTLSCNNKHQISPNIFYVFTFKYIQLFFWTIVGEIQVKSPHGKYCIPELTRVNIHWKMPLTMPLTIHWKMPLKSTGRVTIPRKWPLNNCKSIGKCPRESIGKCQSAMISEVLTSGVQSSARKYGRCMNWESLSLSLYIYIYTHNLSLSLCIYIYIYMTSLSLYTYTYIYIYIYIYIPPFGLWASRPRGPQGYVASRRRRIQSHPCFVCSTSYPFPFSRQVGKDARIALEGLILRLSSTSILLWFNSAITSYLYLILV